MLSSNPASSISRRVVSAPRFMYIVLGVIIQIVMCDAAMLRGRNDLPDMAASRDLSSTQDANKVVITNSCPSSLKLHLRYFEDKLRHVVFKDVRFNQKVQASSFT